MPVILSRAQWDATPPEYRRGEPPKYGYLSGGSRLTYDVLMRDKTRILRFTADGIRLVPVIIDDKDAELAARYAAAVAALPGLRVGDWVDFADGTRRRVSYIWSGDDPAGVQTTDPGGGWHVGDYGASMGNGSLYVSIPADTLTDTGRTRPGPVWFPHHGHLQADCAVYTDQIRFKVYTCTRPAPRY